jgi:hypothetical protein
MPVGERERDDPEDPERAVDRGPERRDSAQRPGGLVLAGTVIMLFGLEVAATSLARSADAITDAVGARFL